MLELSHRLLAILLDFHVHKIPTSSRTNQFPTSFASLVRRGLVQCGLVSAILQEVNINMRNTHNFHILNKVATWTGKYFDIKKKMAPYSRLAGLLKIGWIFSPEYVHLQKKIRLFYHIIKLP